MIIFLTSCISFQLDAYRKTIHTHIWTTHSLMILARHSDILTLFGTSEIELINGSWCAFAVWWDWLNVSAVMIFGQNVRYIFRCVDVFEMNSSILILSVQQPIQVHTMASGDMSHGRAPVFHGNSDQSIVFFENKHRRSLTGDVWVSKNIVNTVLWPIIRHERYRLRNLVFWRLQKIVNDVAQIERRNSFQSQSSIYWDDFRFGAALWKHLFADYMSRLSQRTCDTCISVSLRSPPKSASWKSPWLHFWGMLLTWQYCL